MHGTDPFTGVVTYWLCCLAGAGRSSRYWANGPFATEAYANAFGVASGRHFILRQLRAEAGPAHDNRLRNPRVWDRHPWTNSKPAPALFTTHLGDLP